jgi:cytidylate kinase
MVRTGSLPPPLITVSAAFGAGGSVIAPRLAERLGVAFLDRAIPAEVAERLGIPVEAGVEHEESGPTLLERLAKFAPAAQIVAGAPPIAGDTIEPFLATTEQVIRRHVATGGVILGRAAAIVLHDEPQALHVRLDGQADRRVAQAMRLRGLDRDTAEKRLRHADRARELYVRESYHRNARDPALYHLVVDSTSIDLDACVEILVLAAVSHGKLAYNDA